MAADAKNLTATTVDGIKWTLMATVASCVLQVGYTAVMARLLSPTAFGLMALSGVILRFGDYFAKMGMGQAIVQKPSLTELDIRAAFTSSMLLGVLFAGLIALGAPLAGHIVNQPEVAPIVQVDAICILLSGVNGTAIGLLKRTMRFRLLAIFETIAFAVGYVGLGLVLAWQGFGIWALVGASVGYTLLMTVMAYAAERHTVRLLFSWQAYRPLLVYGSRVSAISFIEFITMSLDTVFIGRQLGPVALGVYSRGSMLVRLPVYQLMSSITKVLFPSFSQVQADAARLRAAYLSSLTLVATLVTPVCVGMAVAAPEIVRILLGAKWMAAVPIVQVITITYILSAVALFAGVASDAAAAAMNRKVVLNLVCMVVLAMLLLVSSHYGLLVVAWALVAVELLRAVLYTGLMWRIVRVAPLDILRAYGPGLLAGVGAAVAIALVRYGLLAMGTPTLGILAAEMLAGAGALTGLVLVSPPAQLRGVLRALLARLIAPTPAVATRLLPRLLLAMSARLERLAGETSAEIPAPRELLSEDIILSTATENDTPLPTDYKHAEPELV